MKIFTIGIAAAVLLGAPACKQKEATHDHPQEHADQADHHEHETAIQAQTVRLDNGARWKANPETTAGIESMQLQRANFSGDDAAVSALAAGLQQSFQEIFDKCTMTGASHEQLHNYLMPLNVHLKELAECTTGCNAHVDHIEEYLHTYANYFE